MTNTIEKITLADIVRALSGETDMCDEEAEHLQKLIERDMELKAKDAEDRRCVVSDSVECLAETEDVKKEAE